LIFIVLMLTETILVTGATGQQGGATARHLLADGFQVRAFVRNAKSASALELAQAGAELVIGDMDDRESLDSAIRGAYGVFSIQPSLIPPTFSENEFQRGLNVVDAAQAAGIQHLVYASVGSADRKTGLPHWEIKWQVEQYIRKLGLPFTILRSTMFMENYADSTYGLAGELSVITTIPDDVTIQHIALSDIGAFAALAFKNPERLIGKAIELAGDELTVEQVITAISRAVGHPLTIAREVAKAGVAAKGSNQLASFSGWDADIPALRKEYPSLMNFDTWLARGGAAMIEKHLNDPMFIVNQNEGASNDDSRFKG
jgi:uncharacterized protein YbjT (DUF2867 family)